MEIVMFGINLVVIGLMIGIIIKSKQNNVVDVLDDHFRVMHGFAEKYADLSAQLINVIHNNAVVGWSRQPISEIPQEPQEDLPVDSDLAGGQL